MSGQVSSPIRDEEDDLTLLIDAAQAARSGGLGIWADPDTLLAYEYRAMEKLFGITRTIVSGASLKVDARSWRERYCVDMRTRIMHGLEDYVAVDPEYRLNRHPGHRTVTLPGGPALDPMARPPSWGTREDACAPPDACRRCSS